MAQTTKSGSSNILVPMAVVGLVIAGTLIAFFAYSGESPQADTDPSSTEQVEQRPTGAGTKPEGEVDPPIAGVTDEIDQVDPAAPDESTIPAANNDLSANQGSQTPSGEAETTRSDGSEGETSSEYLLEENSDEAGRTGDVPEEDGAENFPEGRDAQTDLTAEPDQDVVRDTDQGGTSFVPTPSGPEGRDDNALTGQ